jgi:hypothetical protein
MLSEISSCFIDKTADSCGLTQKYMQNATDLPSGLLGI